MSETTSPGEESLRTGVADVDSALEGLDVLADAPVAEHPSVFESAHEQLRRALDGTS